MILLRRILIFGIFCFLHLQSYVALAQEETILIPEYSTLPNFYEFLPNAFSDIPDMLVNANPIDNWKAYTGIILSSGLLIYYDQPILEESQRFSTRIGLIDEDDAGGGSRLVWSEKIGGVDADFRLPDSPNSYFYYIGDGITSLSITAGLASFGFFNNDYRALNTSSQLMESMLLTGMFTFTSKFTFGRESPIKATQDGGKWRPVPGLKNYLSAVSTYDAFPSGHIATVTSTMMILHYNYPEKSWILPTGYIAGSLLMFSMLNNGVHWAGDYPLGIAIGYVAAKTVFNNRKPENFKSSKNTSDRHQLKTEYSVSPTTANNGYGIKFDMVF